MRTINLIVLHCSATHEGQEIKAATIKKWHLQRGWKDIGYHYVIDLDGTVEKGRSDYIIGAHVTGHNSHSLGICYIGGLEKSSSKPKDTRTVAQKKAILELVHNLLVQYNLTIDNVHCHNEYAAKACPCFKRDEFVKEYHEAYG